MLKIVILNLISGPNCFVHNGINSKTFKSFWDNRIRIRWIVTENTWNNDQ